MLYTLLGRLDGVRGYPIIHCLAMLPSLRPEFLATCLEIQIWLCFIGPSALACWLLGFQASQAIVSPMSALHKTVDSYAVKLFGGALYDE